MRGGGGQGFWAEHRTPERDPDLLDDAQGVSPEKVSRLRRAWRACPGWGRRRTACRRPRRYPKAATCLWGLSWRLDLDLCGPKGQNWGSQATARKMEGDFPSGARGCPVRSESRVTEGQRAEVQRHLEGATAGAGTALSGFLARTPSGPGAGVRRPGLQSWLRHN